MRQMMRKMVLFVQQHESRACELQDVTVLLRSCFVGWCSEVTYRILAMRFGQLANDCNVKLASQEHQAA